ncbi:MAG: 2-oxoacid:ferredoxin oxidoreductase subunit beta [Acidobacteria bacterium]|nr:2-oxoacid:ferredoxin oxidoreductase subunit beta [Acidobacteriota bacterium]NIM60850.1 2-oxoacid:ferredoxin oxidoreductase subunit beta [Acidobacteriota bacterium]NIO58698.1 2-oxoacid:ferredoxin oxidoreductase subunit beta [Acidobacteriota bacterium]NIQ29754.1 2-oxoacid:ferredoxin oxidoreductase subunit beta [Acidobacteriota bacterium]NIQ87038.1 2-oxoacid:ferredoxin oxidoreductase subunit beta [Acidobacteriota bacterium]
MNTTPELEAPEQHPFDGLLREGRIPHIWCPGCGIGSILSSFLEAVKGVGIPPERLAIVSGIGCSGRVAGYLDVDSFHTTHGRPIPFATGLKLARPELEVVVVSGDGDLAAIGGNHLIHAARRNIDINVICINNFNYGMTGGQVGPTTPVGAWTVTSPHGCHEHPFNLVDLAASCGAVYVARWISMDVRRIRWSVEEAFGKRGFTFIEIIAPCPVNYGRRQHLDDAEMARAIVEGCEIRHGADTRDVPIEDSQKIICGKFVDIERPTYNEMLDELRQRARGGTP